MYYHYYYLHIQKGNYGASVIITVVKADPFFRGERSPNLTK